MTQIAKHSFALVAALLITAVSFNTALTVPLSPSTVGESAPILA